MLEESLLIVLSLLLSVSLLSMLSNKLGIAYPIFLVIAGLIIGIIPDIPNITLNPDFVFIIFLPPLLYSAALNTSWRDFKASIRPISLLAIGLVIFTSVIIAYLSHAIIPDFSLSLGFLLGGIISPPDAVAATSIISKLKVPKQVVTILEGESLVNDATSLIVFRFALAAILTGQFILWKASLSFLLVAGMGVFIGLLIAAIVYLIHRFLPTDSVTDTAISLVTPYIMYLAAEHFDYSGVLAVVSGGLFLSKYNHQFLNYESRLQLQSVWNTIVFLLNGTVFILIGMQIPFIIQGMESYSTGEAIGYAVIISIASVVIRILWVYAGTYLPRFFSRRIREREPHPPVKAVFIVAWSGMRGVVSLASALTIPMLLADNEIFPHRNLILFLTFSVILFTLVVQGITLPYLIRILKIRVNDGENITNSVILNKELAENVLNHIDTNYAVEVQNNNMFKRLRNLYQRLKDEAEKQVKTNTGQTIAKESERRLRVLMLEMIKVQRSQLATFGESDKYSDELLRSKENELDLEEARVRKESK